MTARIICLAGMPESGVSTAASYLADTHGYVRVSVAEECAALGNAGWQPESYVLAVIDLIARRMEEGGHTHFVVDGVQSPREIRRWMRYGGELYWMHRPVCDIDTLNWRRYREQLEVYIKDRIDNTGSIDDMHCVLDALHLGDF